jgi:hypothetical protein
MQTISVRFLAVAVIYLGIIGWSGCGCSSARRQAVYGKVISSRPVHTVTFQPVETLKAPAVTVEVKDGAYRFTRSDGPIPGDYQAVLQFADVDHSFAGGAKKSKEIVLPMPVIDPRTRRPVPPPEPPPASVVIPVTVPAKGLREIDLTAP